jgi:hypothetical protein
VQNNLNRAKELLSVHRIGVKSYLEYTLGAHGDDMAPVHVSDVVQNVVILKVFPTRDLDDLVHHVWPQRWILLVFPARRQSRGWHVKCGLDRGEVVQALPHHKVAHPSHRWLCSSEDFVGQRIVLTQVGSRGVAETPTGGCFGRLKFDRGL